MSRREAGPFVIFAPPQAGPSCFGVTCTTGAGRLGFGVSSRAPLKNSDKPPFLFFFFDEVGWEGFFSNGEAVPFVLLKAASSVCLIGSAAHTSCCNVDTVLSAIMLSEQSYNKIQSYTELKQKEDSIEGPSTWPSMQAKHRTASKRIK
jgi:hypothetical protein